MKLTSRNLLLALLPLSLLCIPALGMVFSNQVVWSPFDFLVMGFLLFAMGFSIQYLRFKGLKKKLFWRYLSLLIIVFLLLWAELAVGIFGSPLAGH